MGIKSADQITIVDVTDAYSVMLTSEAYPEDLGLLQNQLTIQELPTVYILLT